MAYRLWSELSNNSAKAKDLVVFPLSMRLDV